MCVLKNCFAKVPLGLRRVVREHTVVGLHRCVYRHVVSSVAHAELLMSMHVSVVYVYAIVWSAVVLCGL